MDPAPKDKTATIHVDVPFELHREARKRAIDEDRPFARLVEDAVREYLDRAAAAEKPAKSKKVPA